jgi:hypothetical protein
MAKSYEKMSLEDLEAENQKLMARRTKIGEEQDKLKKVMNQRLVEKRVVANVGEMSDVERDVLVKALAEKANFG